MPHTLIAARLSLAFATVLLAANSAMAQLAVSANDGHTAFVNNTTVGADSPVPDTVTILDLGVTPPKIVGEVPAPTSVVGPPHPAAHRQTHVSAGRRAVSAAARFDGK